MPFRSPYPDVSIPAISLPEYLLEGVDSHRNEMALIDAADNHGYTYGQFAQAVRNVAGALAARGFRKGDVLAILSPNVPEYFIAVHATLLAGGVLTTLNPMYTVGEIEHQLHDSGARFLLVHPVALEKALVAASKTPIDRVMVLGEASHIEPFAQLMQERAVPPKVDFRPHDDVAVMLYSSGTTGLPKGVMLTHRNLVAALCQVDKLLMPSRRSLLVLPAFHVFGFHAVANFDLAQRATLITMSRFDMEAFLKAIEQFRIDRVCVVPPIVLGLVKSPLVDKYDLSSLKLIFSGAAPLDAELAAACERRIGCRVRQGYGLTETSPPICGHPFDGDRVRHGSVGTLVANTEAKLVDLTTGEETAPDEPGELWVRGPQVMKGYHNQPEATSGMLQADGWLRTGDIARLDDAGWIYIVDRAKELIKYKGMQVAPAELEAVLLAHSSVADAAVIGVPDEEAGEVPKAFIVRKEAVTADDLAEFVATQVAPYKKVRVWEFVDAIPKSPSGKILRRLLRERERDPRVRTAGPS